MTAAPLLMPAQLQQLAPKADIDALTPALNAAMLAHAIVTPLRVVHFMAQGAFESAAFSTFQEDLNYSVEAICGCWPSRFPNAASAQRFAANPQALADEVYAGRMGNIQPNDGWLFRGRGIFQLTGRELYATIGKLCGEPFEAQPDLVAAPAGAAASAGAFWAARGLNVLADRDDVSAVTQRINGGLNGLSDREVWLKRTKAIWGVKP